MAGPKLDPEVLAHLEWLGFVRSIGLVVSAPALVRAGAILDRRDSEGQWLLRACVEERTFDPKEGSDPCVRDFRRCSLKRDIQGFKPGMTESKASPRLFSRCSKRVERVRTGSTEELGQTIGVFLAASLTDHMCMPSGRCRSVLILWTVGLFDCHSLTFYFWVDIERTRPRRPSGSTEKPPPETQPRIQTECGAFFRLISAYIYRVTVHPGSGRDGGAQCLACPIIRTVIFRPVKVKTISMPISQNCLLLNRQNGTTSLQIRSCGRE